MGFHKEFIPGLMNTTTGTSPAPQPGPRKSVARVALFDLNESSRSLVSECFRQFGIETVALSHQQVTRLQSEKFEACVLPLGPAAGDIIEQARATRSNNRMIIFGLGGTAREALRYSKHCLNAVFHEPLERSAALKLVRATRTLVLQEHRRYIRVPVMTEVGIVMPGGARMTATSQEISSGGMSLKCNFPPEPGSAVEVSFSLLTLPRIWVKGSVAWKKPNKTFGVRFDPTDDRRRRLKEWISGYLES
jgi:PilZ domain